MEYRDRLLDIVRFQNGFIDDAWEGPITLSFGNYSVGITTKCDGRQGLIDALASERKMIENTLDMLGVDYES